MSSGTGGAARTRHGSPDDGLADATTTRGGPIGLDQCSGDPAESGLLGGISGLGITPVVVIDDVGLAAPLAEALGRPERAGWDDRRPPRSSPGKLPETARSCGSGLPTDTRTIGAPSGRADLNADPPRVPTYEAPLMSWSWPSDRSPRPEACRAAIADRAPPRAPRQRCPGPNPPACYQPPCSGIGSAASRAASSGGTPTSRRTASATWSTACSFIRSG